MIVEGKGGGVNNGPINNLKEKFGNLCVLSRKLLKKYWCR